MNAINSFGNRLRTLRKKAGLTQEELAEKVGVHLVTVSRWENDIDTPKTLKIKPLANALNVSENDLLYDDNSSTQPYGWVLSIKISHSLKEDTIDMTKGIPTRSSIITTPEGGFICLGGDYSLWTDDGLFKKLINDLKKFRNTVIQNGIAQGGIKQ